MHWGQARLARKRPWVLAALVIALVAGHGLILRYVMPNVTLSGAVLSGVVLVLAIKLVGLLGTLYALVRRRSRSSGL
ncbi:MAG: hypothetical protein M3365_01260 [Gemmatimonadota bacterium]|nr:hypothetical protein [Gemmatimonadota bacterium]